jgi:hypothetical protein
MEFQDQGNSRSHLEHCVILRFLHFQHTNSKISVETGYVKPCPLSFKL